MLLYVLPKQQIDKSIPKFSTVMLAKARQSCPYPPKTLPARPIDNSRIVDSSKQLDITITDEVILTESFSWTDPPNEKIDDLYDNFAKEKRGNTFDTLLEFSLLMSVRLLWFKYLCEGAGRFWPSNNS